MRLSRRISASLLLSASVSKVRDLAVNAALQIRKYAHNFHEHGSSFCWALRRLVHARSLSCTKKETRLSREFSAARQLGAGAAWLLRAYSVADVRWTPRVTPFSSTVCYMQQCLRRMCVRHALDNRIVHVSGVRTCAESALQCAPRASECRRFERAPVATSRRTPLSTSTLERMNERVTTACPIDVDCEATSGSLCRDRAASTKGVAYRHLHSCEHVA